LVDTSGSMGTKMAISKEAVHQFLKTMEPEDEACLIEFGDRARVVEDFSNRVGVIEDKISGTEAEGLTALLDAVSLGLDQMKKAKNTRRALVIISDGGDNNSRYSAAEIRDLIRKADVQVYSMGVFEPFPLLALSTAELSGPKLLRELSEQTGGRVFAASQARDLPAIAARIGVELRNQYILAYSPAKHMRDGKYRRVEVRVKAPPGLTDLKVRWRTGYYAPID
jgi:Ca-activated chloride channel homolog